jgi:hypothetical protein
MTRRTSERRPVADRRTAEPQPISGRSAEEEAGVECAKNELLLIIREALEAQAEKYRKELAAGASGERTEELLAWFAFQEQRERFMKAQRKREGRERRARAVIDQTLVDLPRPHLLN